MLQRSLCRRCLDKMRIPAHRMNLSGQARWLHINSQKFLNEMCVLLSPTMHVFDRRAKLLQRERAAANKEVEKFDFLKEEVQSLIYG